MLLIHGDRDDIAPIEDVIELAGGVANGRMLRLDGVGHYLSGGALAAALDAELDAYRKVLSDSAGCAQLACVMCGGKQPVQPPLHLVVLASDGVTSESRQLRAPR